MKSKNHAVSVLLTTAYRHLIRAPNVETAHESLLAITGSAVSYEAFCDAVADCLRDRLIYEPVRLPEGALQCHWHLELTPAGVAAARPLVPAAAGYASTSILAPTRKAVTDGGDKPGHDD
jgi:hypothetical protein